MRKTYYTRVGLFFLILFFSTGLTLPTGIGAESKVRGNKLKVKPASVLEGIYLGKSIVFTTGKRVTKVAIGDERIASVRAISQNELLIRGNRPGWTNLIIWYGNTAKPDIFDLQVQINPRTLETLERLIKRLVPSARVRAIPVNKEVILDGTVESQRDMQRVLQIATAFFKKEEKNATEEKVGTVVNIQTGSYDMTNESNQRNYSVEPVVAIRNNLIVLKGCQQVQLQVKIAEVSRSGMKKMGLAFLNNHDWAIGIFPAGSASAELTGSRNISGGTNASQSMQIDLTEGTIGFSNTAASPGQKSFSSAITSTAQVTSPLGGAFQVLLHSFQDDSLAMLTLLKSQGLARFLATPTLVTMSGQEASFRVGGEFPIPVTSTYGAVNVEYKKYGITLRFTPYVVDRETITLNVSPEVSSPDFSLAIASGGVSVPGLKTRVGYTTLQLKDGQTFVMAGLLRENSYILNDKIPFLGDLPYLGTFFTRKQFEKDETELIVVVTPHLVRPLNPGEVPALPGENMQDNISDFDFFLTNKNSGEKGDNSDSNRGELPEVVGGIGYSK